MYLLKSIIRFGLYLLGLFIISIGINLAILSDLGVSPVSAFIVPLSRALSVSVGTVTSVCYSAFVLIEIVVLGRRFRWKNLLQVPFSIVFGGFVDLVGSVLSAIQLPNYAARFAVMLLGVAACAVGAVVYIAMDVVPNPSEGLILAFCERFGFPFGRLKIVTDCIFVALGMFYPVRYVFCIALPQSMECFIFGTHRSCHKSRPDPGRAGRGRPRAGMMPLRHRAVGRLFHRGSTRQERVLPRLLSVSGLPEHFAAAPSARSVRSWRVL